MHVQRCSCPPAVKLHVSLISTQDQKPTAATTAGHSPFGPAACGIARPSGVCAAAMMLSSEPPGAAGLPPFVGAPALPPLPLTCGCEGVGFLAAIVEPARRVRQRARSASELDAGTSWSSEEPSSIPPQPVSPAIANEKQRAEYSSLALEPPIVTQHHDNPRLQGACPGEHGSKALRKLTLTRSAANLVTRAHERGALAARRAASKPPASALRSTS